MLANLVTTFTLVACLCGAVVAEVPPPNYTCGPLPPGGSLKAQNDWHWRGTSLGGWLVLEPWITPSLFYQFLGADAKYGADAPNKVGLDSYTFCTSLGGEEANKQLKRHWRTWVTEEQILNIAQTGVDTIRIPVGDWMFSPYEPYIGCFDGALEELDRVLDICKMYKLKAFFDIHAMKGGQNSFDNSGKAPIKWTSPSTFEHVESAGWLGSFDLSTQETSLDSTNLEHSVAVVKAILNRYKSHPVVAGIEAINEPWYLTPIEPLKHYYWEVYQLVQRDAPHWVTLLHDSFRPWAWDGFLQNCSNFAFDTHLYEAWGNPVDDWQYGEHACARIPYLKGLESTGRPIVVGEWSLAMDNCAMWLNGFNNNVKGYPMKECKKVRCPDPYMGSSQPGAPPDPAQPAQGPFGSGGYSTVAYGQCLVDADTTTGDEGLKLFAHAQLETFETSTHGQFFWNFRTELEPRWSYQEAVKNGWLPSAWTAKTASSFNVCDDLMNRERMKQASAEEGTNEQLEATASQQSGVYINAGTVVFAVLMAASLVGAVLLWLLSKRFDRSRGSGSTTATAASYASISESENDHLLPSHAQVDAIQKSPQSSFSGSYQQQFGQQTQSINI